MARWDDRRTKLEARYGKPLNAIIKDFAAAGMTKTQTFRALGYSYTGGHLLLTRLRLHDVFRYAGSGTKHKNAKMTPDDVRLIRKLAHGETKMPVEQIAAKFEIDRHTAWDIVNFVSWINVR